MQRQDYDLNAKKDGKGAGWAGSVASLSGYLAGERGQLALAFVLITASSAMQLLSPYIVGRAVDEHIARGDWAGTLRMAGALLAVFAFTFAFQFSQMRTTGGIGQRLLYRLREAIFAKLQDLPIAFFDKNRAGDLISRINNDTDKLSQFFSETLVRFVSVLFLMVGSGMAVVVIQPRLGLAALVPAAVAIGVTQALGAWLKARSKASLSTLGGLSAEVQESLDNFKVIVAFDRRDYFVKRFADANEANYTSSVRAGLANAAFVPLYEIATLMAQFTVVAYGLALVSQGRLTVGALLAFLLYLEKFYGPFRQIAMLWSSLQLALAGWDRISDILGLRSDLAVRADLGPGNQTADAATPGAVLAFRDVHFGYADGDEILRNVDFTLQRGKTYAFVGPTGGGKTTTASLMARLYDPTGGAIYLNGRDIRSYEPEERARKIGFILQEPFLFSGTVRDNVAYGNAPLEPLSSEELLAKLREKGLEKLLARFEKGLDTEVKVGAESISLGQRQLVAFLRAILRQPELLILDEATANIDTVTEKLLEEALQALPPTTTKVVIAHRLNTIQNADEIFFVNGGTVAAAGSFEHAVELLLKGKRTS